jgi:hypothetical protein
MEEAGKEQKGQGQVGEGQPGDQPQAQVDQGPEEAPRTELRRPSRAPWIILVGLLILGAGALWLWVRRPAPRAPAPAQPAVQAVPAVPTAPPSAPAVSPASARSLLAAITQHLLYRRALVEEDFVHRCAVVADNLAEGVSPRAQLGFLAPASPFTVTERGGRSVIAAASYQRYDGFGDAVASVDAKALASAYRGVHPALEAAYRALGYPGASLDTVVAKGLRRIEAAPVVDGEVAVERNGGSYVFADPRLESKGAVDKHLLRMGPRNTRLLQGKAREIMQALGFPEAPPADGGR